MKKLILLPLLISAGLFACSSINSHYQDTPGYNDPMQGSAQNGAPHN